jgi:hypothetical protein
MSTALKGEAPGPGGPCEAVEGSVMATWIKHDPEKWGPVFRKDHAQTNTQSEIAIQSG